MIRHKIIIDTDPGVDDAQAIAFAIAHPEIDLLGLTTVFGNAAVETTTQNALLLLDRFGRPDIPVASGASKPIQKDRMPAPDFVHGADGLGNLNYPHSKRSALTESAAEFIVRQANEQAGELSLIAIGPLTNIALAIELDPELPNKVKQLVIMGGAVDEPGNVTPLAEANMICDPHAADIIMAYDWPMIVIGLDVTHRIHLTDRHTRELLENAGETGRLIWDTSRFYVDFYMSQPNALTLVNEQDRACAMHDVSAVIYLIENDAFELVSGPCRVATDGIAVGQFAMDRNRGTYVLPHWEGRPDTHAAIKVDARRVRRTFLDTLINHAIV